MYHFRHFIILYNKTLNKDSVMYLFFGILFFVLLFFFFINFWRRKKIIKRVCSMSFEEKCEIMNDLVEPFGYAYIDSQDIFTSRIDAWQRNFGYCTLYDETASHFNLIFDCLPIYFNYENRTWLIELWKGQYGINSGAEMGVYYANGIIREKEYNNTLFQSVRNEDMLGFSFSLYRKGTRIADVSARHWWLTAFSMGRFTDPADLYMRASITFPNYQMTSAFIQGLESAGYSEEDICVCCNTVTISFTESSMDFGCIRRFLRSVSQCMNRFWCYVYLNITNTFCLSLDRILYLYYYLPIIFRKMLRIKSYKKFKKKRRNS